MKKEKITIFFVDDDPIYLKMLENNLKQSKQYNGRIYTFTTGEDCLNFLHLNPDVIVLDYYLNGTETKTWDGLLTLEKIKEKSPKTQVIMLSGQDKIDIAVNSIKKGAFDYVPKSESAFVRTQNAINNIIEANKLKREATDQKLWVRIAASIFILAIITFLTLSFFYPLS
jgi:two-component system, OmpR family, response regulator